MTRYPLIDELKEQLRIVTFKKLPVGERFEFASVLQYPYSGMARGPWKKTGTRTYTEADKSIHRHEVGSINVKVIVGGVDGAGTIAKDAAEVKAMLK